MLLAFFVSSWAASCPIAWPSQRLITVFSLSSFFLAVSPKQLPCRQRLNLDVDDANAISFPHLLLTQLPLTRIMGLITGRN